MTRYIGSFTLDYHIGIGTYLRDGKSNSFEQQLT